MLAHRRLAFRPPLVALATSLALLPACSGPESASDARAEKVAEPGEPEKVEHGLENTLTWVTTEEFANTGYIVYRGETAKGPWYRMTEEPLPGGGTTSERNTYTWIDETIEPGKVYYYFVRAVPEEGLPRMVTPILEAPAKTLDESAGAAGSGDAG